MKEFEVSIHLRNNRLKELRVGLGLSIRQLADMSGIQYSTCCAYEALRESPFNRKTNSWKDSANKLSFFLEKPAEFIWPDAIKNVTRTKVVRKMDLSELLPMLPEQQAGVSMSLPISTERSVENAELWNKMWAEAKRILEPRELDILQRRTEGERLGTIGLLYGIMPERVRQVENIAISKLREHMSIFSTTGSNGRCVVK